MAVNDDLLAYVADQISAHGEVRTRKMFGGAGIYLNDLFIAIVDEDRLYLKADDTNRKAFELRNLEAFRPFGDKGYAMSYFELPMEELEDPRGLAPWIHGAVEAAQEAERRKRKKGRS